MAGSACRLSAATRASGTRAPHPRKRRSHRREKRKAAALRSRAWPLRRAVPAARAPIARAGGSCCDRPVHTAGCIARLGLWKNTNSACPPPTPPPPRRNFWLAQSVHLVVFCNAIGKVSRICCLGGPAGSSKEASQAVHGSAERARKRLRLRRASSRVHHSTARSPPCRRYQHSATRPAAPLSTPRCAWRRAPRRLLRPSESRPLCGRARLHLGGSCRRRRYRRACSMLSRISRTWTLPRSPRPRTSSTTWAWTRSTLSRCVAPRRACAAPAPCTAGSSLQQRRTLRRGRPFPCPPLARLGVMCCDGVFRIPPALRPRGGGGTAHGVAGRQRRRQKLAGASDTLVSGVLCCTAWRAAASVAMSSGRCA